MLAPMMYQVDDFSPPPPLECNMKGDTSSLAAVLAHHAVQALVDEAELTPKPALVDLRGSGAHHDLTLSLLLRSANALGHYFCEVARVAQGCGADLALRERLGSLGREAERVMMDVTEGVNTHRGAIWALGLLTAAAAQPGGSSLDAICSRAAVLAALPDAGATHQLTNGTKAARRYGTGGARSEAEAGFPHALRCGLPALRSARRSGLAETNARLHALLEIMSTLEDTCLLHRGGPKALWTARRGAARVLALGGPASKKGSDALRQLDESLLALWASPGGSADMLAATLFLDRLASMQERTL